MKRTKSMAYKPTTESRELYLYATNNGDLYRQRIQPAIASLRKKAIKGTYDAGKAIDLFYYIACAASDMYYRDFGYKFSVQDRFTTAVEMEDTYSQDEIFYELEG